MHIIGIDFAPTHESGGHQLGTVTVALNNGRRDSFPNVISDQYDAWYAARYDLGLVPYAMRLTFDQLVQELAADAEELLAEEDTELEDEDGEEEYVNYFDPIGTATGIRMIQDDDGNWVVDPEAQAVEPLTVEDVELPDDGED